MKLADVAFWHLAIVPGSLRARPLLKVNQPRRRATGSSQSDPYAK
jgi:hypothetical protein